MHFYVELVKNDRKLDKKRASRLQGLDIIASNAQGERLRVSATSLKQSFAETL